MEFTISNIAQSIARYLALSADFSGVAFMEDPATQGVTDHCMFIQQRGPVTIKLQPGGRYLRTVKLDLTYLEPPNARNLQRRYQEIAEKLDKLMEYIPYIHDYSVDPPETTIIRTYDRSWTADRDGLHYNFELRVLNYEEDSSTKMQSLDVTVEA